jgi:hypothetical protein
MESCRVKNRAYNRDVHVSGNSSTLLPTSQFHCLPLSRIPPLMEKRPSSPSSLAIMLLPAQITTPSAPLLRAMAASLWIVHPFRPALRLIRDSLRQARPLTAISLLQSHWSLPAVALCVPFDFWLSCRWIHLKQGPPLGMVTLQPTSRMLSKSTLKSRT